MKNTKEYLRRNLLHSSAVGVYADIHAIEKRLLAHKAQPRWLLKLLDRAHAKAYEVSKEMAAHRNEIEP